MADEATAVMEPETSAVVEEAPPLVDVETVSEAIEGEETEASDAAETQPETETFTKDEVERREKEVEARIRAELEEQQTLTRWQQQKTQAAQYRQQHGIAALNRYTEWVAKQVEEGNKVNPNPQVLASLASGLESMVATEQWENIWNLFENHQRSQAPNWKPSTETVKQLRLAEASGDPVKMFGAAFDYMRAYVRDVEAPKLAAELRNQEREKEKKAATVASTKAGDAARANADRPTAVSGGAAPRSMTLAEIDRMPTAQWLAIPKAQRDRMLEEARARIRR